MAKSAWLLSIITVLALLCAPANAENARVKFGNEVMDALGYGVKKPADDVGAVSPNAYRTFPDPLPAPTLLPARPVIAAPPANVQGAESILRQSNGPFARAGLDSSASKRIPVPSDLPVTIDAGQQGKHIRGHNDFMEGRSYLNDGVDPAELLAGVHNGRYPLVGSGMRGNPIAEFGRPIGIDGRSGAAVTRGQIHYGKRGAHIVPDARM